MKTDEASSTALSVAQCILYRAGQADTASLVSEEVRDALHKILRSSDEGKKILAQSKSSFYKKILSIKERLLIPGISLHYILRKRYIEDYTLNCIKDGVTQVVNLGAGFDTLCYRLSKRFCHVNFIEIDHPATGRLKVNAFKDETCFDKNLTLIQVDFTQQTLEDCLGSHTKYFRDKPTLFISEGVYIYLTEEQVRHQLRVLREMTTIEPKLIFTYSPPDAMKSQNNGILLPLYLKIKGEPFNWAIMNHELGGFLKSNGYVLKSSKSPEEFKSNYLRDDYKGVINIAEHIAIAEGIV